MRLSAASGCVNSRSADMHALHINPPICSHMLLRPSLMRPCSQLSRKTEANHHQNVACCAQSSQSALPVVPDRSSSVSSIQQALLRELEGINRGIFGVQSSKKAAILSLIEQLEAQNPTLRPTEHLDQVAGDWRLLYSTIVISGGKKTKLGLREFVQLGDFIQSINTADCLAVNRIAFSVSGLGMIKGSLTIKARYEPSSPERVSIMFQDAVLVPSQLQKLFEKNYDLLLSIFNPDGHLDITYVDSQLRVGRDDKGNTFLLERC